MTTPSSPEFPPAARPQKTSCPARWPRRRFLRASTAALLTAPVVVRSVRAADPARAGEPPLSGAERLEIQRQIDAHRPSRLTQLPAGFRRRVGATHVAGKYHLTDRPFLLEGAARLLELGTRLGKFWLIPRDLERSYPFHHRWDRHDTLVSLVRSEPYAELLSLPFETLIFEAHAPAEEGWKKPDLPASFYEAVTAEFYELAAHLYRVCRDRAVTIILQHWEGDWLLRGAGQSWDPPPPDWPALCARMQRWLNARQTGVRRARAKHGAGARCCVAHAAEVNRVADAWRGIPTMTREVLPGLELDLVSYSAYDGLQDGVTLWRCLEEIRRHARTGPLFGTGAVYVGEIGLPENEQPERVAERWDEWLGALLAREVPYVVQWELYCNEPNPRLTPPPRPPLRDPAQLRGFWLVRPDGTLSQTGRFFHDLWQRAER